MNILSKYRRDLGGRWSSAAQGHFTGLWGLSSLLLLGLMIASGQAWSEDAYKCPAGTNGGTYTCVDQWPVGDHSFQNSWPTDAQWAAQHNLDDYADDATYPSVINFLGDSANPGFYFAQKNDYLFFRVRVAWNGTVSSPTCTTYPGPGSGTPPTGCTTVDPFWGATSGTIFIMIQQPSGTPVPQWGFAWDIKTPNVNFPDVYAHGLEMTKTKSVNTGWNSLNMDDFDGSQAARLNPDFNSAGQPDVVSTGPYYGRQGYIRTVNSVAKINGCVTDCTVNEATTFVDFAIACSYLTYLSSYLDPGVSLACGQTWNLQLASTQQPDDQKIDFDVGAHVDRDLKTAIPSSTTGLPGHITSSPTYSVLQKFGASVRGAQVLVEWDTQSELGTQGFELARLDAVGEFQPLHEGLIRGQSPAGEGGGYRFLDPTAVPGVPVTYRLTEVESNGNRREVGQFPVTPLAPSATARAASVDQPARSLAPGQAEFTPRPLTTAENERLQARRAERDGADHWGQRGLGLGAANSAGPPANRAAIAVRETGLYQVSTSALALALDWPEGKVKGLLQAGQLRLTHQGVDIAWQAAVKDQGLLFYGEASRSIYDPESVYVVQQGAGSRMAKTQVRAQGAQGADSFTATVTAEENLFGGTGMAKDPEEDYWFWSFFMKGGAACGTGAQYLGCDSRTFTLAAPEATGSGLAHLRVWLRGVTATTANPDHRVRVMLNGTLLGEGQWDGLTDYRLDLPVAGSLLRADGQNQVQILALADPGVPVAANNFYLDRLELDYPRRYRAAQDSLRVTGEPGTLMKVEGFTSPSLQILDLSDTRSPRVVTGAKIQSASVGYQVSLVPASATTSYLLVAEGAVRAPTRVRTMETLGRVGGSDRGAQYLVIGPGEFDAEGSQSVQRLLSLRYGQGLSGRFVPLQALYDDYGDGQKTPHAIRRFLAEAFNTWKVPPAYVLLAGKGTFDPKDYLGYGTDRLPVLMALTPIAGLIAADQRFVDFNDDGIGDLAIGRLPAATAAEFAGMVDKLIAYEDAGPPLIRQALLVADGPDIAGNHTANSEATAALLLAAGLPDSAIQRLYLDRLGTGAVRAGLLAGLQGGTDLLNYFGHAGVTALDHGLFSFADAKALTHPQVPVMLGMTCLMNRFEFPQLISLGEALMMNPVGGAAAVWSSGGYSYDASATALNDAVLTSLLQQRVPRLGDAIQAALAAAPQSGELAPAVYNLLGDPATVNLLQ